MFKKLIEKKIKNLTKKDIIDFAYKNNICLTSNETNIIYDYIKSDWKTIIYSNHYLVLEKVKNNINPITYKKIEELIILYKQKYKNYLI